LIREGIETRYKLLLEQALKEVEILKGDVEKREVYSHDRFVEPMLDYVVEDFVKLCILSN
jgi:type I restriction enzyme R subunit